MKCPKWNTCGVAEYPMSPCCPPEADMHCNINVTKTKTKVKTHKIKAWGWIDDGFLHASANRRWMDESCFPVVVTVNKKYFKKPNDK